MSAERLQKWALIAEIVGGLAVIITLVFLIFEIRENSAVIRSSSYGQYTELLNDWRLEGSSNPEIARLWRIYADGNLNSLNEVESQQLQFFATSLWGIYEASYFAYEYGVLGVSEWDRLKTVACSQYRVAQPHDFWQRLKRFITPEFAAYIETDCRQ